ncbi:MAG: carbohydrate kinase family protein [Bacteroidetes bacterium]|nr:carbohydrate kinase family protein [Bacteroidota bacterium]
MKNRQFDLVAVGHIVKEMIIFPDRELGPVLGSPPAYCLVASAKQGMITGIITKIGTDFPDNLIQQLVLAGVDTNGISKKETSSSSQLVYDAKGNKKISFPTRAEHIYPSDIPKAYTNCKMIYVCTMEDDVQLEFLKSFSDIGDESAIDLGGFGGVHMSETRRSTILDVPSFALEAASHFHLVKASDEDCRTIFGASYSLEKLVRKLLRSKTKVSIITLGSQGVLLGIKEQGVFHIPPLEGSPVDATGGGDTFMAGFLSE